MPEESRRAAASPAPLRPVADLAGPAAPGKSRGFLLLHRRALAGAVMIGVGLVWTVVAMVRHDLLACLLATFFVSVGIFAAARGPGRT